MSAFGTSRLLPAWAVCDERMEGSRSVAPSSPHGLRRTQKYSLRPHGSDGIHICYDKSQVDFCEPSSTRFLFSICQLIVFNSSR